MTIWRRPGGRLEIAGYVTALVGPVVLTAIVARAGADELPFTCHSVPRVTTASTWVMKWGFVIVTK